MAELGYSAMKRSPQQHQFAFGQSSLPSTEDEVIDGDNADGILDGNE